MFYSGCLTVSWYPFMCDTGSAIAAPHLKIKIDGSSLRGKVKIRMVITAKGRQSQHNFPFLLANAPIA